MTGENEEACNDRKVRRRDERKKIVKIGLERSSINYCHSSLYMIIMIIITSLVIRGGGVLSIHRSGLEPKGWGDLRIWSNSMTFISKYIFEISKM